MVRLNACHNRPDVSRAPYLTVQDGWVDVPVLDPDNRWQVRRIIEIPNAFQDQECPVDLPECGDCKWRLKND